MNDRFVLLQIPDDLRREMLLSFKPFEVFDIMSTSNEYSNLISRDEDFWKQMLRRDYPTVDPENFRSFEAAFGDFDSHPFFSTYQSFYVTILKTADQLVKKYTVVKPRYLNLGPLREDVYKKISQLISRSFNGEINGDVILNFSSKLWSLLTGIEDEFIGYYNDGKLDGNRMGIYLELVDVVNDFLKMFLVIVSDI